jgi:hypothetical protein
VVSNNNTINRSKVERLRGTWRYLDWSWLRGGTVRGGWNGIPNSGRLRQLLILVIVVHDFCAKILGE